MTKIRQDKDKSRLKLTDARFQEIVWYFIDALAAPDLDPVRFEKITYGIRTDKEILN